MSVLKIKDADGNWVGVTAIQGEKGDKGMSPIINVNANTSTTYKLRIQTEDKDFITPNLKGQGGIGGSGNISSELGTIDNYKDFSGKNIPTYNSNMPPLQCFEGGTTYVFDREVTMLVYNGGIDDNGNVDIDKYLSYTGKEIYVPTTYYGTLTDYLIYNPVPKKEWDTWENPNIVKFLEHDDDKFYRYHTVYGETVRQRDFVVPNLKINRDAEGVACPCPFDQGDAYITYDVIQSINDKKGQSIKKKGRYNLGIYNSADFPFVLDEPVMYSAYDKFEKEYTNPVEIPYPSDIWELKKDGLPIFKRGKEYKLMGMDLSCCDKDGQITGNERIMEKAELEQERRSAENPPREYEMVIADPYWIEQKLNKYNAKPVAPAMYVGLEPLKNYTIESMAGDCALILSNRQDKTHVTTEKEVVCYPTTTKTANVNYDQAKQTGTSNGNGAVGGTTSGPGLESGITISYDYIDTTQDPLGKIDVPCALSCPYVYLKKGESYTFQVEDEDPMWGIYICCWQEEDYHGIKIVEGIEPYSLLMEERMASGATKFNLKTYWTPGSNITVDTNQIMQEFNIKLSDNTTENDYCRFLTNETIKHFDLDDFSMLGHTHSLEDVTDLDELKETIPSMLLGTSTLVDGSSELPENTFYFVYEE